jgi:CRISPR-associated protein Cas1
MKNILAKRRNACFFVEHAIVRRKDNALEIVSKNTFSIPIEQISVLILGSGTSISYSAVSLASEHKVVIQWCRNEHKMFCYAEPNRTTDLLLRQVKLYSKDRNRIAKMMFEKRFGAVGDCTIEVLRGLEGVRVRQAYQDIAKKYGVNWNGRKYTPGKFEESDLPNQMITFSNQLMYGLCCGIIVQLGLSPAIGFVHTGTANSFVYDIADLYKIEITMEVAFKAASYLTSDNKQEIVELFNEKIQLSNLPERIVNDMLDMMK